jgi:hypothetical protein
LYWGLQTRQYISTWHHTNLAAGLLALTRANTLWHGRQAARRLARWVGLTGGLYYLNWQQSLTIRFLV